MAKGSNGADDGSRAQPSDPLGANSEIARRLRQLFEGVVSEGVPDRFAQLLSQLDGPRPQRAED